MIDILLVEDNIELANLIKALLTKKGFCLYCVTTGEEALEWLKENKVKILVLDIMLPGIDGFAICKEVREKQNIPIIIISAKSDKSDKLMGFELGADNYIEKPVDLDILEAQILALLKRNKEKSNIVISDNIKIDILAHKAYLEDKLLELNSKEFDLLLLLVKNAGKTLNKNYIFSKIWGLDSFSEDQTLTVHINMLRSKIEKDKKNPLRIITVWGVGYRYEEV